MFNYLINSFKRKIARRIYKKYPPEMTTFTLSELGKIEFVNWANPLVLKKDITQSKVNFFKKLVPKGGMCIDIGANIGEHSVSMALAVGNDGLVLAFDPNPNVFEILSVNARLNLLLTNIKPYNFAISEEDGDFYYNSSEASFSNGGISLEPLNRHGRYQLSQKIRGINLESFLRNNYPDDVMQLALIKIDTEGYDKEILKSIAPVILAYKPVIITECFGKLNTSERHDLYDSIQKHGYELYYFQDFDEKAPIVKLNRTDMEKWKHFDMYALPV